MTRETKIGLLVGLAFIIVIGILLSDHINTTSDPARASITDAGNNVRDSVNAPGAERSNAAAVIPNRVEPPAPVQTQRDVPQQSRGGATIVEFGPGGDPCQLPFPQRDSRQQPIAQNPAGESNVQVSPPDNGGEVAQGNTGDARIPAGLQEAARRNGQELVAPRSDDPVGIHPTNGQTQTNGSPVTTARGGLPAGFREVKAEQNDSVSRLAAKYLGANNKANREAIIKANPSLQNEPHMVIAGKSYVIPPAAAATPVQPAPQQPQVAQKAPPPAPKPEPAASYYTVKDNDNLWKIAAEQLGSGNRWTEIRDLNQDVLKGGDGLKVNMRLKLPPKAVASNN